MSNIEELRKRKNLTQRELANLLDVDVSTIRNWEKGRGGIEAFVRVAKLCDALSCQPDELYKLEEI